MHPVLHIFTKDVRRLWPAATLTLLLLATLTALDGSRSDWLVTSPESWLNLLLPIAWAFLIALDVQHEPLVGENPFWLTRPCRWQSLLASKIVFALLFVHLPSFLSDAVVLTWHGFQPLAYLPALLWKQALLAAFLTVPALAVAALCRNITQFVLAAIFLVGAAAWLEGVVNPIRMPWIKLDQTRLAFAAVALLVPAAVIAIVQYASRRTRLLRGASVAAAVLVFYFFGDLTAHPANRELARVTLGLRAPRPGDRPAVPLHKDPRDRVVALPVSLLNVPAGLWDEFQPGAVVLHGSQGQIIDSFSHRGRELPDFAAWVAPGRSSPQWLMLAIRPDAWNKLQYEPVRVTGMSHVTFHRPGNPDPLMIGERRQTADFGTCSATLPEAPSGFPEDSLKVLCESPWVLMDGSVRLWQPGNADEWTRRLASAAPVVSVPRADWLSPLNRSQTFFHLVSDSRPRAPGDSWVVPRSALNNARLAVTSDKKMGPVEIQFDLGKIVLSDYVVKAN